MQCIDLSIQISAMTEYRASHGHGQIKVHVLKICNTPLESNQILGACKGIAWDWESVIEILSDLKLFYVLFSLVVAE